VLFGVTLGGIGLRLLLAEESRDEPAHEVLFGRI
jgi:hypothetical protein